MKLKMTRNRIAEMSEKSKLLYDLMLRKGYPEGFCRLICLEMSTDFTAERMIRYVSGEKKRLEDVADEMVAIKDLKDRLINKHISEHANNSINNLYRNIMRYINDQGMNKRTYRYPFGEYVRPLVQQDQTPKKVFVLGVYASAVHARWVCNGETVCQALAVASEPRIFWDGDPEEAKTIIDRISIPAELGQLVPAGSNLNGPSAKVLDDHILTPLGFTREDAWLCDCLPETRLNPGQVRVIKEKYDPLIEKYGLNEVTIPVRPSSFCNTKRAEEISGELFRSEAALLVLLGDIPIAQYLNRVSNVPYKSLREYTEIFGYGNRSETMINGRKIEVLPLAHPRQIGALGSHSERWYEAHQKWESS